MAANSLCSSKASFEGVAYSGLEHQRLLVKFQQVVVKPLDLFSLAGSHAQPAETNKRLGQLINFVPAKDAPGIHSLIITGLLLSLVY